MTEEIIEEETLLSAIDEEGNDLMPAYLSRRQQIEAFTRKNQSVMDAFLGTDNRASAVGILPRYYGELLTWALHQYLQRERWQVVRALNYAEPEAVYTEVNTGKIKVNLLTSGQLLIEKEQARHVVTVDINARQSSIRLAGPVEMKESIDNFIAGVLTIAEKENFYRGQKIEFTGGINFLDVASRSWDSIIMDAENKQEIMANTVDFLRRGDYWTQFGIPLKRGVILAGEPGTGKTIVCKALMSEADSITCITTVSCLLDATGYLAEIYELANDLRPSIIFLEDIDLIGQDRYEFGYGHGPALSSLLNVMDGVESQDKIVTVATTNCLDTLDKALSNRPSRFDRVIKLTRPSLEQRSELVNCLCHKIPLNAEIQDYIVRKTDNYTPAQIQEIVFSMVIQKPTEQASYDRGDVDRIISRVSSGNKYQIGFMAGDNHSYSKSILNSNKS